MAKAFVLGFLILIFINITWFFSFQFGVFSHFFIIITYFGPFIVGLIIAYVAPKRKIFLAVLMAIPSAILTILMNAFFQLSDKLVDFPGLKGGVILLLITMSINVALCLLGGILGYFASRIKS